MKLPNEHLPKLFDVVALINDLPGERLRRGQVGTIIELHSRGEFEVEFSDDEGKTYAQLSLSEHQLIVLHHAPAKSV